MSLDLLVGDLEEFLSGVNGQMVKDIYDLLWESTPVDTGYARSRWQGDYDGEGYGVVYNDADYIIYLNNGSSEQAPAGFVQAAIEEGRQAEYDEGFFLREEPGDEPFVIDPGPVDPDPDAEPPDVG